MKNIKLLPILLFIFFPVCAQNNVPRVYISNGQIKALLYLPDNAKGYYRGTRFDRSGIVASLKYEGHEFFGKWFDKYDPFTHDAIMGPVEEFGEEGYENTPLGGTFLKLGVGLLIKPDAKPYDHFRLYPFKNPGKWKVKTSGDEVVYIQTLKDESYSYIYEKHIRLTAGKPEMVISHRLRNIGKLPLSTNVYDHNFPVIDKQAVGP